MKPSSYWLLVTTFNPIPFKCYSACWTFRRDTTNILLVSSGKYPHRGSLTIKSIMGFCKASIVPPAPVSSTYYG